MDRVEHLTSDGRNKQTLSSLKEVTSALEELYERLNDLRDIVLEPKDKQAIYAKQLDVIKAASSNLDGSEGQLFMDEVLEQLEGFSSFEKELFLTRLASRRMDFCS